MPTRISNASCTQVGYSLLLRSSASHQGPTLLHFSAQRNRFLWDTICLEGVQEVVGGDSMGGVTERLGCVNGLLMVCAGVV